MLPDEAITEYIKVYRKVFGVTLSRREASFRANNLVNLYKAVLGSDLSGAESDRPSADDTIEGA